MVEDLEKRLVDATALAHFVGVSRQRVGQLTDAGVLLRSQGGKYRLADCVRRYLAHLRNRPTLSAADTRVREARAVEIELRTAQRGGEFIFRSEHDAVIDSLAGIVRTQLSSLAARCTRDLAINLPVDRRPHATLHAIADGAERLADQPPPTRARESTDVR